MASGLAVAAVIDGTSGDDRIQGTTEDDSIDGKAGNDTIEGMRGSDRVIGGNDHDELYGGRADASIGADDSDLVTGEAGMDVIVGSDGTDDLRGGLGNDTIYDALENDAAVDTISGHEDDDEIYTANTPASRDEIVACGAGVDVVYIDTLDVVASDCETVGKTINGTQGDDTINGFNGDDAVYGEAGSDRIYGGDGHDQLWGGNEQLTALEGKDEIHGEAGADTIFGGSDADKLYGEEEDDIITDGPQDDAALDDIQGGNGNDEIDAGNIPAAPDIVNCGDGTDTAQVDALDVLVIGCENVESILPDTPEIDPTVDAPQEAGITVPSGGDFQAQAFNCWGRTDNPHMSTHYARRQHYRVAAEVTTWCATDKNNLYTTSNLYRLRAWGWVWLDDATKYEQRVQTQKVWPHWDCRNKSDDFWYRAKSYHRATNNGNAGSAFTVGTSSKKIWCY